MRTQTSAMARVSSVKPGPSAPSTMAIFCGGEDASSSIASACSEGVNATTVKPWACSVSMQSGHAVNRANGTRKHVSHRDADTAPVQGVRCLGIEQHRVESEGACVSEQRPEVLVIVEPLEHRDPGRVRDQ